MTINIVLRSLLSRLILIIICSCVLFGQVQPASAQQPSPRVDSRWHRTYAAGPYSEVGTAFGGLYTNIPLLNLKGPGDTSLSMSIFHTSNVQPNTSYGNINYLPGAGWHHSLEQSISYQVVGGDGKNEIQQVVGNEVAARWTLDVYNGNTNLWTQITRRPGVRADIEENVVSGVGVTGFTVTDQATRTKYIYDVAVGTSAGPYTPKAQYMLGRSMDAHGNTITYTYDYIGNIPHLTKVTDASGRYITLTFQPVAPYQLTQATLTTTGGTREWQFTLSQSQGVWWLADVRMPTPSTNAPRPTVTIHYNSNANIDRLWDPRGARYVYEYKVCAPVAVYPLTSVIACSAFWKPYVPNPATNAVDSSKVESQSKVQFDWTSYTPPNNTPAWTLTCAITETAGHDQLVNKNANLNTWWSTAVTRTKKHIYSTTPTTVNGTNYTYKWLLRPIKQIQDAPVSRNNNENYWETFEWSQTDACLTKYTNRRGFSTVYHYLPGNRGLMDYEQDANGYYRYYQYNSYDRLITKSVPTKEVPTSNPLNFMPTGTRKSVVRTIYSYNQTYPTDLEKSILDPVTDPNNLYYGTKPGAVALTYNKTYISVGNGKGEVNSEWIGSDTPTTYSNFDIYGNPCTVTDAASNATTFTFDAFGNKITETPPAPLGAITYAYDGIDRLVSITKPGNAVVTYTYDLCGNRTVTTDEKLHTTTTLYDARNRPFKAVQQVDADTANDLTTFTFFDERGNVVASKNPKGKVTYYTYDERDQQTSVTYPDNSTRSTWYDQNGNVQTVQTGRFEKITFKRDNLDQVFSRKYSDKTEIVFTYSPAGLRTSATDKNGKYVWDYTDADQLSHCYQPVSGKDVYYTYDPSGRRQTMSVKSQNTLGQMWTYTYTAAKAYRTSDISQTVGSTSLVTYTYFASGLPEKLTFGNGESATYVYDGSGRNTQITYKNSGNVVQQTITTGYDEIGNPKDASDSVPGGLAWTSTMGYDFANRLISESRAGGANGAGNYTRSYTYDKNGNRSQVVRNQTTYLYTVDDNDKFLSGDGYGVSLANYDADGNPKVMSTPTGSFVMVHDIDNHLTKLTKGTTTCNYVYDPDGLRVAQSDSSGTSYYVYDGSTIIAELDANKGFRTLFAPGLGFTTANGIQTFLRVNTVGSNVATVNASGTPLTRSAFDAYGVQTYVSGTSTSRSPFRFGGQVGYVTDDETGFDLLGQRYFIPTIGRFLTEDPLGHEAGPNLYSYCDNNPLAKLDPDGKDWIEFQGQFTTWYFGKYGDRKSGYLFRIPGTSGSEGFQFPEFQSQKGSNDGPDPGGPVPQGRYSISLIEEPSRRVRWGKNATNSAHGIQMFGLWPDGTSESPNWGTWRARLDPSAGTNTYGRGNFYLHDSGKGFTHGCVETNKSGGRKLLNQLIKYRSSGHKEISVHIGYRPGMSTRGATKE